jgi:hypothetical protein
MESRMKKRKTAVIARRVSPVLALLTLMVAIAAPAQADGRFVYETCDPALPAGNPPPLSFNGELGQNYEPFQTCALADGSIGVKAAGKTHWFAWLSAPIGSTPGGWVEAVTLTGRAGNFHNDTGSIEVGSAGAGQERWPAPGLGNQPRFFLIRTQPPTALESAAQRGTVVYLKLSCTFECEPGAYVAAQWIAATEVDPSSPVVSGVEGSLVAGDVLRGHQGLQAQAADLGGGVRSLELKINGVTMPGTAIGACSIAAVANPSYTGLVATSPSPCPPSLSGSWDVDSTAPPFQNGPNSVQICASDFATIGAPNTTCSPPQTVMVDNSCTESPVPGGANLSAGFGSEGSDQLTVGFGTGTEIVGRLTDANGGPVSGATICMESQPVGSQALGSPTVATARTDGEGHFGLEVKPGINRQLVVGYRHGSFQITKKLTLGTRARPTINLSRHKIPGGKRVAIFGKLPNPNPGGHVLVLQGSGEHGHTWLTFKKVITGPQGEYSTTYRFTKPRRKTGFRVRVVAPAQAGYEYETGTSKAARIRVRP